MIYTHKNDTIRNPLCDLHTKTILLGTISVIYTHIQNDIIKDPFSDLHTHKKKPIILRTLSVVYKLKKDIIRDPFCDLHRHRKQ